MAAATKQRPAGILIKSESSRSISLPAPTRIDSSSSSLASSSSSNRSSAPNPAMNTPGRKIRFAPLPDPRLLEQEEDLDDESITSLSDDAEEKPSQTKTLLQATLDVATLGLSLTPVLSNTSTSGGGGTDPGDLPTKKRSWSTKILAPFHRTQSFHSDTGQPFGSSMFRASSRESVRSTQSANPSSRRASLPFHSSSSSDRESRMPALAPSISPSQSLPRPSSAGSGAAGSRRRSSTSSAKRRSIPQVMFNGRIYGRNRGALTPDPFQRQLAYEPQFVEWGYGGMGSVPNTNASGHAPGAASAAADWSKLQGGKPVVDDDDGSGMGWVKRRREAREQEAREKERLAAAAATNTPDTEKPNDNIVAPTSERDGSQDESALSTTPEETTPEGGPSSESPFIPTTSSPISSDMTPSPSKLAVSHTPGDEQHHHTAAVAIPAPPHYQPHGHNRITSVSSLPHSTNGHHSIFTTGPDETSNTSEDESDDEGDENRDEDENDSDEEEEALQAQARRTAECAGIEKISRHREQTPPPVQNVVDRTSPVQT